MPVSVTIIDVARRAGVSKTTVSAVLHGKYGVNEKTRQSVLKAVRELGYASGGAESRGKAALGALVMTDGRHYANYEFDVETGVYSQNVINGIIHRLAHTGYGLITEHCAIDTMNDTALPMMLRDNQMDGVFLIGALKPNDRVLNTLLEGRIPTVAIGRTYDCFDSIRADVEKSTYIATKKLIEYGHRRICLVNCPARFFTSMERFRGFSAALEEFGVALHRELVIYSESNTGGGGYAAIKGLYESGAALPGGIISANNSITMGVLRYFYDKGIRVPDDVSLIGHEDSVMYVYASPALTAVDIKKEQTGEAAAEMMLRRLGGSSEPPLSKTVEPTLTIRDSTAPAK